MDYGTCNCFKFATKTYRIFSEFVFHPANKVFPRPRTSLGEALAADCLFINRCLSHVRRKRDLVKSSGARPEPSFRAIDGTLED